METKNEEKLRLDRVRLTPALIEEIHLVQTGGMSNNIKVVDSHFNNEEVNEEINRLNTLSEFFVNLYQNEQFDDPKIIMDHLCHILNLKSHFEKFRV